MNKISLCERCGQPIDSHYGPCIMIPSQSGTWTERVDGSPAGPGDLHCCYDCSELLEEPARQARMAALDALDDAYLDIIWPRDRIYKVYLLLRNQVVVHTPLRNPVLKNDVVVYVGKSFVSEYRVIKHWKKLDYRKKPWVFDEVVETPDGPYTEAEALRREKALIKWYQPIYNTVHRGDYYLSRTYDPSLDL